MTNHFLPRLPKGFLIFFRCNVKSCLPPIVKLETDLRLDRESEHHRIGWSAVFSTSYHPGQVLYHRLWLADHFLFSLSVAEEGVATDICETSMSAVLMLSYDSLCQGQRQSQTHSNFATAKNVSEDAVIANCFLQISSTSRVPGRYLSLFLLETFSVDS